MIKPTAALGSSFLGQVVLTYDTFTDGSFLNQIGFDDRVTSAASISVPAAAASEPASSVLLSAVLAGLYLSRRRWKKSFTVAQSESSRDILTA